MAISEDTAALVAAQLTVAWAMRSGVKPPANMLAAETEAFAVFNRLREKLKQ